MDGLVQLLLQQGLPGAIAVAALTWSWLQYKQALKKATELESELRASRDMYAKAAETAARMAAEYAMMASRTTEALDGVAARLETLDKQIAICMASLNKGGRR